MNEDYESMLEDVFLEIGIREGQEVLDFGCGSGHYTIPVARVVGERGIVYAVDKKQNKLEKLRKKVENSDLSNIRILKTAGGTDLDFPDESIDVILLYDVFSYYGPESEEVADLLVEANRVLNETGFLSVFPKHVDTGELKKKIRQADFDFRDRYSGTLLHDGSPEGGKLLNFIK